jgi:hypothetical protein
MRPLPLNLATRPFRNNTVVGSVLAAAAAALFLATASNLYVFLNHGARYAQLHQEERDDRGRLAALEKEERVLAKEVQARDFRRLYERGKFANELIRRRAFSWTLLFNKLEAVVPAEVMMSAIRPNITADDIVVRVEGVAKNHGGLIAFEDALLTSPVFARVYPANERRLNPARPEISFALNFDYLPDRAAPAAEAIAAAAPAAPASQPAGPPAAATAAPEGAAPQTSPAVAAGHAVHAAGTVGRDGRPRTAEALARLVTAPGGIYLPPQPPPREESKGRTGKKGKGSPPGKEKKPAAPGSAAPGGPQATATPPAAPEAPSHVPRGKGEDLPRRPADPRAAALRKEEPIKAAPAERLDVRLDFAARPAQEVYAALSRAHGVRFEFDPAVELQVKVTANLGGRKLSEALAVVGRAAGHHIIRQGDGRYRVAAGGGGEAIADRPVREEDLAAPESRP